MSSDNKPYQKQKIREALEQNGWKIQSLEKGNEWWQDELWRIESKWTPLGFTMELTFDYDPDLLNEVWCVIVSRRPLVSQDYDENFVMGLMHEWEKEIPALVDYLNQSRTMVKK